MTINFLPNDPLAANMMPLREQTPKVTRPASRASVTLSPGPKEAKYALGTADFLFWQAREAVLTTLEMWEAIDGPVTKWARSPSAKRLKLLVDHGEDLNAYYDGETLSFFHSTTGGKTTFSGASTDVVAHECGHALLDVIRPQLWDENFTEAGAFHEAFGDCVAILTALYDKDIRIKLLAGNPTLATPSFVEAIAEDLSDGIKRKLGPSHPSSAPRRALNKFKWALPSTLPSNGPPPMLTREVHSFARVFVGCFYDLVCEVFAAQPEKKQENVWAAAKIAGKLLIEGARNAQLSPRFFQAVGRTMVLADQQSNSGANTVAIGRAFGKHGIVLGSSAMIAPRAALKGSGPKKKGLTMSLASATAMDLVSRFASSKGQRFDTNTLTLGGKLIAETVFKRAVNLGVVSKRLAGVVAFGTDSVLVGESNKRAAMVSSAPEPAATEEEVRSFVESLLDTNNLRLGVTTKKAAAARTEKSKKSKTSAAASVQESGHMFSTHTIRAKGGKKVVERVRFACGCHAGHAMKILDC